MSGSLRGQLTVLTNSPGGSEFTCGAAVPGCLSTCQSVTLMRSSALFFSSRPPCKATGDSGPSVHPSSPGDFSPCCWAFTLNFSCSEDQRYQICRGDVTKRGRPSAQVYIALIPLAGRKKGCFCTPDSGSQEGSQDCTARSRFHHDSHRIRKQFRVR